MQSLSRKEVQLAYIKDVKAAGINGGTSVSAVWSVRDLNTLELSDPNINWLSLGVNQFTLQPGVYEFDAACPVADAGGQNQARLYNVTDSLVQILGQNSYAALGGQNVQDKAMINGILILTAAKVFQIQHIVNSGFAVAGFGISVGTAWSPNTPEIYTTVKIKRIGD